MLEIYPALIKMTPQGGSTFFLAENVLSLLLRIIQEVTNLPNNNTHFLHYWFIRLILIYGYFHIFLFKLPSTR